MWWQRRGGEGPECDDVAARSGEMGRRRRRRVRAADRWVVAAAALELQWRLLTSCVRRTGAGRRRLHMRNLGRGAQGTT